LRKKIPLFARKSRDQHPINLQRRGVELAGIASPA
jgi:hypothetical protein